MGDRGTTTTSHHAMKRTIVIAASLALVWGAPQFLTDNIRSNCRSEVTTVFEETETETVNKVICQTEFREECNAKVAEVCRNVTTGEVECQNIEKFECVDSITNKCGIEKVLKNVSYTETVCRNKLENICEKEFVGGEARPVEGSCATKPTEVCEEMTRFQEEFVDEDRCRDIPIKDCKNVQSEVCSEKQELVCEQHTEDCQIVPHEECEHILEKIPKKVSKKITKVVCDESEEEEEEEPTDIAEDESANADDNANDIINNIFEIFGITNNGENEIEDEKPELVPVITTTEFMIDDGLLSESTTKTTTTSKTVPTTTITTTSTTSTSSTTTTLRTSTVKDLENIPTEPVTTDVRRMDGSKIIFSDKELEARNKDLANRVYLNVIPTRPTSTNLFHGHQRILRAGYFFLN